MHEDYISQNMTKMSIKNLQFYNAITRIDRLNSYTIKSKKKIQNSFDVCDG